MPLFRECAICGFRRQSLMADTLGKESVEHLPHLLYTDISYTIFANEEY